MQKLVLTWKMPSAAWCQFIMNHQFFAWYIVTSASDNNVPDTSTNIFSLLSLFSLFIYQSFLLPWFISSALITKLYSLILLKLEPSVGTQHRTRIFSGACSSHAHFIRNKVSIKWSDAFSYSLWMLYTVDIKICLLVDVHVTSQYL